MNTNILIVLFAAISIALYLNIIATYHVWNADVFSVTQRILQSFLIWFIPIILEKSVERGFIAQDIGFTVL